MIAILIEVLIFFVLAPRNYPPNDNFASFLSVPYDVTFFHPPFGASSVSSLSVNEVITDTSLISKTQTLSPALHQVYLPVILKPQQSYGTPVVVTFVYATSLDTLSAAQARLNGLAAWLDILHVNLDTRTVTAVVYPQEYAALVAAGYAPDIDASFSNQIRALDLSCYHTVEQLYDTLVQTVTVGYPDITHLVDYGDSWEKVISGGQDGYDLYGLEITNKSISGPKPVAVIDSGMHGRELVPTEIAIGLIKFLTTTYGQDPDVTWLVDYHRIVMPVMVNPDGRNKAFVDLLWRKNIDNDDGCTDPGRWGTDLNRNFYFKWGCCGGSSANPCAATYRGPSPDSEPEVYFYESYVRSHIPDQWEYTDDLTPPAPVTTTGILVNMHSYDPSILYPWGWTSNDAPNDRDLKAIAEKYSAISGYPAKRSLYTVDGLARDWGYGDLGIPSLALEAGPVPLPTCDELSAIVAENLPALQYLVQIARTPYMLIHGPDVLTLTVSPSPTVSQPLVQLNATIDDVENGGQTVEAAAYYIDLPPWISVQSPLSYPMSASDGTFDDTVEAVEAELDIHDLPSGRHTLFVQGKDVEGHWGPVWATWLTVKRGWITGDVVDAHSDLSLQGANISLVTPSWTYTTQTTASGNFTHELFWGSYTVTVSAADYHPAVVEAVDIQTGLTTSLQIRLTPLDPPQKLVYLPFILKD